MDSWCCLFDLIGSLAVTSEKWRVRTVRLSDAEFESGNWKGGAFRAVIMQQQTEDCIRGLVTLTARSRRLRFSMIEF